MVGSTVGERINELIMSLGIKKVEFADKIGVDQSYITQITNGKRNPSKRVLSEICRTFNVNQDWLTCGIGEVFVALSTDEEIAKYMGELLRDEKPDFRRRFIAAMLKIPREDWEVIERIVRMVSEETKKADPD